MEKTNEIKVLTADLSTVGLFRLAIDTHQLSVVYLGYLIFTLFMTIGTLETNKVLFFMFVFSDCLFIRPFIPLIWPY
ncbi:hypothetical protein AAGS61_16665 [Lysinibacillus sp. KU-BSD001]